LKHVTTKGVIFSGGVLGTVPLLLKLRKSSLPNLSPRVGDMIRSNNEALIVNTSLDKNPELHKGLSIGSILELDETAIWNRSGMEKDPGFGDGLCCQWSVNRVFSKEY